MAAPEQTMKLYTDYHLPEDKEAGLAKAVRLEWWSIGFMLSIVAVMALAMGSSQAMKMALIEDVLSLTPPITFLLAMQLRRKRPTASHPYGYSRASLLAFLAAAVAILLFGLFMLYDSATTLIQQHHPTLGHFHFVGNSWGIWSGWIMIVALIYSMIPPMILGRMKLRLARDLHESTLYADATMNKADWLTAAAGIGGVLGLGMGFWWADAVAAGIIALDVLKDGVGNVRHAMGNLMDRRPTEVSSGNPLRIEEAIREALLQHTDVTDARARLREEGHIISGEILVVFREHTTTASRAEQLVQQSAKLDWRLKSLVLMPVESIELD
ncbi:MAG: divalent metal cation (Fe/Co/Zn/Cd) transporter [Halopseudomonas sp.]|jgi:divalent metal cation (Fe/Co/Zn/Cd) transporter|tara:strand:+ start:570 stop:1547 length:978 start_codon:yes stop_codon:yes gene_type:complete